MIYISTRGTSQKLNFQQTLMAGLASDGGLYMPESFPQFSTSQIKDMSNKSYQKIAYEIIKQFVGTEIDNQALKKIIFESCQTFTRPEITPIKKIKENQYVLELFYGPTLAFKDLAMQLLSRLIDYFLQKSGKSATIITATSGDTGAAAACAFANMKNCQLFILYPNGKISSVQEQQIINTGHKNIFPLAIAGDFDDCQKLVKQSFIDENFRKNNNLLGVNSINWGRIMAQIVYYFFAFSRLNYEKLNFCVPTGNFGDIFAGYCAKKMGLPIEKLIIATNSNDILHRVWQTGRYEKQQTVATISPSMDIQISSNFERLLWEAANRDSGYIVEIMSSLEKNGYFELNKKIHEIINKDFISNMASESDTKTIIADYSKNHEFLPDPHTAVGLYVANQTKENQIPSVVLATAHPAKFPKAIESATGIVPKLPEKISFTAVEKKYQLPNSFNEIKQFIEKEQKT